MQIWDWLIYPVNLTPHGYCLLWAPGLIWLHAISDSIIAIAYFSIPLALAWFVHRRRDLQFRWVFLLFVCFILACGLTHVLAVYTLWVAAYGLEGVVKVATAILSVATAVLLWPLIPRLLALPAPAQLEALNASLSEKVAEQERTYAKLLASEEKVRLANARLEAHVAARTADLTDALRQRDLLLREVYHRVKNNLQIVDSVIMMQAGALKNPADKAYLESLRGRIFALGLVHQQLMTSADFQTFDLAPFLRELTENLVLAGAQGEVAVDIDACPITVDLDYAVPMGLIVTELVTNSLKHAFAGGDGRLRISVAMGDGPAEEREIVVTVSDNGIGDGGSGDGPVPESATAGTGIGKRLIDGLLRQLKGRMVVETNHGMTTRLFLPQPRLI